MPLPTLARLLQCLAGLITALSLTACATPTPGRVCTGPLVPINAPALTPNSTHEAPP